MIIHATAHPRSIAVVYTQRFTARGNSALPHTNPLYSPPEIPILYFFSSLQLDGRPGFFPRTHLK